MKIKCSNCGGFKTRLDFPDNIFGEVAKKVGTIGMMFIFFGVFFFPLALIGLLGLAVSGMCYFVSIRDGKVYKCRTCGAKSYPSV